MKKNSAELPAHLQKYMVEQDYDQYTPIDQACWRYVLRQLRNFLKIHAHGSYLQGLEKTGIEIERIPRIEDISAKLEKFGWRALPVSGFIPPAAFMELQSLGVLPIASAMRSIEHLTYTPAPDIVHEAAGHAPILIQPEFSQYLQTYAQVARKALLSSEDLALYEAIRLLSDLKEHPDSSETEVDEAQKNLEATIQTISFVSEASLLGRMNWWTAEYGLIGDLKNPKIIGAGLLSSVEESKHCLSEKVKKIPLSLKCIETNYDITEPQPQLYVASNFQNMTEVLNELAKTMAYQKGGLDSVRKAIQAKTVNTIELDSGLQISGRCSDVLLADGKNEMAYLKFEGPSQLAYRDVELPGHNKSYHSSGYGTALGPLKNQTWSSILTQENKMVDLVFQSAVRVKGLLKNHLEMNGQLILLSFENCSVQFKNENLFEPAWGVYDLAIGEKVVSVFGGPADRGAFGETDSFVARRVSRRQASESENELLGHYQKIRDLREKSFASSELENSIQALLKTHQEKFPKDWLLLLECFELLVQRAPKAKNLIQRISAELQALQEIHPQTRGMIADGLLLAAQL